MSKPLSLAIAFAAITLSACASINYGADYDEQMSFADLRTFDWVERSEEADEELDLINPFLERRLRRSVEYELEDLGYVRDSEGDVDLLVDAFVVQASEEDARVGYGYPRPSLYLSLGFAFGRRYGSWYRRPFRYRAYPHFGFSPYFGYPFAFWFPYSSFGFYSPLGTFGRTGLAEEGYFPGTLIVDVFHAESGELMWRGWADRALSHAPDEPGDVSSFIAETVHNIMEEFPPER